MSLVASRGAAADALGRRERRGERAACDSGVRWFGYEPETPSGGTCGWFDFDWHTLVFEVRS